MVNEPVIYNRTGIVLVLGTGDTGQLGLGPEIQERTRPAKFNATSIHAAGLNENQVESFVQVVAGGMHTLALTLSGDLYSFGCNDEGALGRELPSGTDEPETRPGKVDFPDEVKIKMISAGDSHSAALDTNGCVWLWGTFRGASGPIGLTKMDEVTKKPLKLTIPIQGHGRNVKHPIKSEFKIIKIVSGQDHLVLLTEDGRLLSMGCAEQGQLGRIAERFCRDGGRSGLDHLLQPAECRIRGNIRFSDVWAGGFATFARCAYTGSIYACGLNNYGQLSLLENEFQSNKNLKFSMMDAKQVSTGDVIMSEYEMETDLLSLQGPLIQYMLTKAKGFATSIAWKQVAISMHHTIALDADGNVYAIGRREYGRLGLGKSNSKDSVVHPEKVSFDHLKKKAVNGNENHINDSIPISWIGVGESCSYAVERGGEGRCFAWGMGNNLQLAQGDADDDLYVPMPMQGKNLEDMRVLLVDAGGQHTVLLAQPKVIKSTEVNGSIKEHEAILSGSKMDMNEMPTCQSSPVKQHEHDVSK
ncbi:Regulator of chromosome condensation [Cichlidogyrus casuarinus]|uniref:Regulator of chromosome condensation n=1 Tax=Cichlidogyrus casuarinus TaxID=1844966 RepID=A0ABD2QIC5_9PLAT